MQDFENELFAKEVQRVRSAQWDRRWEADWRPQGMWEETAENGIQWVQ